MPTTLRNGALAALPIVLVVVAACGGSTDSKTTTPTASPMPTVAAPTEDAGALATRGANSPAAKLGPAVLNAADFPADMSVLRQRAQIVQAGDVPGLTSAASGFSATIATSSGDEFVNLIAIVLSDDAAASAALDAITPENFLPALAAGAPDLTTSPLDVANAPPGSRGFSYSGTGAKSPSGQTGGRLAGQALGFARGSTYVLVTHAVLAPSTRGIDVATIANAINARLESTGP